MEKNDRIPTLVLVLMANIGGVGFFLLMLIVGRAHVNDPFDMGLAAIQSITIGALMAGPIFANPKMVERVAMALFFANLFVSMFVRFRVFYYTDVTWTNTISVYMLVWIIEFAIYTLFGAGYLSYYLQRSQKKDSAPTA